ncbi:PEP-CTERM sorting domain-containing protein [Frigoriglobus tundricola]|uniref:PEP-CTERM sorting domain-containing protein n=1 Tax=Frigoriglobus tundricola TaxID=2774151 RepID=UPI00148EA360|nr:PEP-CTERM sorting domain-containing protein [Frigoriglobus tundricola]
MQVQRAFVDATVSGRVGTEAGQTAVDWRFVAPAAQVQFNDGTVVTVTYQALAEPDSLPLIAFDDGSPSVGPTGSFASVLDAEVTVAWPAGEPGGPGVAATPEPATGLLLAGFALCGAAVRGRNTWRACPHGVPAR